MRGIKLFIDKILSQIKPYMNETDSLFLITLFLAVLVLLIHLFFMRYRLLKYIPGIVILTIGIISLFKGYKRSILAIETEDLHSAVLAFTTGISSLIVARMLGILAKRKRIKKVTKSKKEDSQ